MKKDRSVYNLPNILTISRIVVIPLIFLSVYVTSSAWAVFAAILFIAASITDYFDGYLARARGETSAFGRLLDPIADKLLVASALVVLLAKPDMLITRLSYIPVVVILCREILVSGLREFLMEVKVGMPVTRLAKWKTGFQMTALSMLLLKGVWYWGGIGEILLWVAAVLTFITGYQYFQKSLDYIHKINKATKVAAATPVKKVVKDVAKKVGRPAAKKQKTKTSVAKKAKVSKVKKEAKE
ncbi:MAG: CDP-diacylglycerol--glycerol-3-phosphate 3-phosphatidyltransferase [Alphaproteobacteria bacterium]|nr:CDP-diacylglycerol--glycerol-3-phosphate 3-phosphatidyltransferase [Alphaproteobacteria bacterium]